MADLYRKTSLEKMSSPEQLDKMIVITPPSFWGAVLGAALIVAAALLWAVFGRLPVNVNTQGIYVSSGGVYSLYAENTGVVSEVAVKVGDSIEAGDIMACLDTDNVQKKLSEYEERIQKVRAVTMDSEEDIVTADNKNLMDIKGQMLSVDQTLEQDTAVLALRQQNLAEQRKKTSEAEQKMRKAEAAYYASLKMGESATSQIAYTEAQSAQSAASSYLEAAYSSLDQADVALTQAQGTYDQAKRAYEHMAAQRDSLGENVKKAEEALENAIAEAAKEADAEAAAMNDKTVQERQEALGTLVKAYNESVSATEAAKNNLDSAAMARDAAGSTKKNYQDDVNRYSREKLNADSNYVNAKNAYALALQNQSTAQASQTAKSNAYNIAMSEYNSEHSALVTLEDSVAQMKVQVEGDRKAVERQTKALCSQFEATKSSIINQLALECGQYKQQLEDCIVRTSVGGTVSAVNIVPGSMVQPGTELLKVKQGNGEDYVVVCYLSLGSGKKVAEGMAVFVYPTTVNKQEYGHMEAVVESVDPYVASAEELRTRLGNDSLVEAFLKNGPVVGVTCRLKQDPGTASGYYWSNSKGNALVIGEGTLVEASVVADEKAPISMLIPYLKEKLTVRAVNERD